MTFIASVLPGLRDLRAPFAAGTIWILTALTVVYPYRESIQSAFSDLWGLSGLIGHNAAILAAVVPFAAYIVGLMLVGLLQGLASFAIRPLRAVVRKGRHDMRLSQTRSRAAALYLKTSRVRERVALLSPEGRGRLKLVIGKTLREVPEEVRRMFPPVAVVRDLPATLLRLSKESPEQFQSIDRLRGEAEFRLSIAPPLAALVVICALRGPWWTWLLVVGPLLLVWQGLRVRQNSNDLLITAAYLGYAEPPILSATREGIMRYLEGEQDDRQTLGDWLWWFLYENGLEPDELSFLEPDEDPA
ncbi:hypothetical protein ACIBG5_10730 [Kribbella sp. NPDC050241]|uniref:hypothetical protein n=1 Tax=Kribbella sp. NPDC050241 TaxID=3364115 RepID=UPI0037A37FE0